MSRASGPERRRIFDTGGTWRLSMVQRALILGFAATYLLVLQPWHSGSAMSPFGVYAAAASAVVLALLPPRWRLGPVLAVMLILMVSVNVTANIIGAMGPADDRRDFGDVSDPGQIAVPERFRGHWAGHAGACGSGTDDLAMHLGADRISLWESEGEIRALASPGANQINIVAELTGEGESWMATFRFSLSEDGSTLITEGLDADQRVARYRCAEDPT
ncbi:hypothetical protein [Arenimonas donghaensis]|nr:hypothetical protein [Arenimonas donghaensis]